MFSWRKVNISANKRNGQLLDWKSIGWTFQSVHSRKLKNFEVFENSNIPFINIAIQTKDKIWEREKKAEIKNYFVVIKNEEK